MFPLWFGLLGGSFVPLHFDPCIPPIFWVLWFIYNWQGFTSFPEKGKELANEHGKEPRPQDHD
jgi:hypothetical protein